MRQVEVKAKVQDLTSFSSTLTSALAFKVIELC
jgi:hypothetical protein